jgi:hypothetical protein
MFSPFSTSIARIIRVRVVPEPESAPFVAPVTLMSLTAKVVGSMSKNNVKAVVVTEPEVPFTDRPEKLTWLSVGSGEEGGHPASSRQDTTRKRRDKARFIIIRPYSTRII